ncbi:YbbR family protein [Pseudopedobacter saltans DSM 12145]|uniref:YbbR family protein n=1 Tax=Pseudopedobacter saltans (strain ATCC 51119 / DSM 12145 / JCM 21818 / CCUG 39354 / LMG 10337 / NBRC 100064 / NCIMB 13643) TaxID=762903 RepID=F0SAL3_PSESL|nr:CdaR family protein [Pseudopedobacter saltans]ADY52633.1 YbbR family protein [Pseudopedobacter saltans DSM 12145]
MALIRLSLGERKRISMFFTCIILAFAAWLIYSLSMKYDYNVKAIASFKSLPQNKAFYPLQSDTVVLIIRGTGWQLLFNKLSKSVSEIKVDLNSLERRNFVSIKEQMADINNQFFSNQTIIKVLPDTLFFDFTTRTVKRVPIRFKSELEYKKQFGQSKEIILKPSHVTVTGPAEVIKEISHWDTDTFKAKGISGNISSNIELKKAKEANISIFPNRVEFKLEVEEFTEKEIEIPIKVINNPNYYKVKLVPAIVKVYAMTSLSDYSSVDENHISATVDLSLWADKQATRLPVTIVNRNPFVQISRIVPQQVDFMISK